MVTTALSIHQQWRLAINMVLFLLSTLLISETEAYQPMRGVVVKPVSPHTSDSIDIGEWLANSKDGGKSLLVFGTYAADFNTIEYGQRLRYYWPKLEEEHGFTRCAFLLNCQPDAATVLAEQVDLPSSIELWVDNTGQAARTFGVGRGWLPDNDDINPFLKLFGMLWGLGAWATLPAVLGGYIGNPFAAQPWIEDALAVGQKKGRWPDTALEIEDDEKGNVRILKNKFENLPLVGEWPRPPLELATLRLQSMLGVSLAKWKELAPDEEALESGVLTQLGGCIALDGNGDVLVEYRDPGICAVANFEDLMKKV